MKALRIMTWTEFKLFLREPTAAFFTLFFPVMLLVIFGGIWGNEPNPFFGGVGYIDTAVPAFTAMIIATTGLVSLSIQMAEYREYGILRRMKATPVRPYTILMAQVLVIFAMTVLGMLLLVIFGKLLYGLRFSGNLLNVILAFLLCSMSFFAFGFIIAGLMPTARTAQVVAMVLFYPMLFLSGSAIPREILPEKIRLYAQAFPLTHVVNLMRGMWVGEGWQGHAPALIYLFAMILVGIVVSTLTFRWE